MRRIEEYARRAQERAKRRKSRWNLLLIPLSVVGIAATWAAMVIGLLRIQHSLVPQGAILASHTRIGGIFLFVPALFPAMAIGMMLANLAAWCIIPARRVFQKEARGVKGTSFKEAMKHLSIASAILVLIAAPLSIFGTMNYFYVTESGVYVNPLLSVREQHYDWSDIVAVETRCIAERDNLHLNYILHMKDGQTVDLLEEPRMKFVNAFDQIKPLVDEQAHIRYTSDIRTRGVKRLRSRYRAHHADRILEVLRSHS
ncbi:MAG: hypothetical protein JSU70_12500 [Phycisphaerales bacterium]|nr:MAG: hypothetical protein JSU70_12500 [Phycisphaerales bacterium]